MLLPDNGQNHRKLSLLIEKRNEPLKKLPREIALEKVAAELECVLGERELQGDID